MIPGTHGTVGHATTAPRWQSAQTVPEWQRQQFGNVAMGGFGARQARTALRQMYADSGYHEQGFAYQDWLKQFAWQVQSQQEQQQQAWEAEEAALEDHVWSAY